MAALGRQKQGLNLAEETVALEVPGLNLFYGDKQALFDVSMNIPKQRVTAFIGPSGCGKSTLLRTFNRMNDLVDGCRVDGQILLDGHDIYQKGLDVAELRRRVGMVFQKPNPFPKSIYENVVYGLRIQGVNQKRVLDETVGVGAEERRPVGRGEGPPARVRPRPVRRPAAASGDRPYRGGAAGSAAARRTLLGTRPDLHPQGRRADLRAEEQVHHRHRDPQHAAGRAGFRLHPRSCTWAS